MGEGSKQAHDLHCQAHFDLGSSPPFQDVLEKRTRLCNDALKKNTCLKYMTLSWVDHIMEQ